MVNPNRKRGANSSDGSSREKSDNTSKNSMGAWEENTMAILDTSGFKDSQDVHDDRLCFLEAVRSASLASEPSMAPSWRMFDAVFQILVDCNSLELTMASYQLLTELDKRYPRVYVMKSDKTESSLNGIGNLVVVKEAWSPFNLASGGERTAEDLCSLFDSGFCTETLNWLVLKESVLNILLVMELDVARKEADMHGLTSRLDGFRTRRSNEKSDGATLEGMLNNFSTAANTKNIVKRVTSGAAQLLLAHAFQACLALVHDSKQIASSPERIGATLSEICNSLISAFRNLRKTDEGLEITSFAKEALFAAATVLKRRP
ncbi:hypothetical protein MUK42_33233 [Musa troglodytarum]|uniref:Uncharacterized protein n=1 Tax=Musa troglodytarum TaxID=320322 RepID=A0A9E7L4L9_9LILI|nr:hypothetical protein MUK42_33233 [Musa troglodytarum]